MTDSFLRGLQIFRPQGSALSAREAAQVQVCRLSSLLGVALFPIVGLMLTASSPDSVDSMSVRLGISGILSGIVALESDSLGPILYYCESGVETSNAHRQMCGAERNP